MHNTEQDKIQKIVELAAPVGRVWRALTDYEEFGAWFRVQLDGPFEPGARSTGKMTYPGVEGLPWLAYVERMDPESLFSLRWHLYYPTWEGKMSEQPTTLVEFRLEAIPTGTRLTITESGFAAVPDAKRLEAMRSNTQGWDIQAGHIAEYVKS